MERDSEYSGLSRDRRSILKTSAAALVGGAALPVTTVARSERGPDKAEKVYNASLNILENRGPEAQAKFLEKHNIPHTYQKNTYVMDPPEARDDEGTDEGSVSIQSHFDDDSCIEPENCGYDPDLECSLSISCPRDIEGCYATLSTRYRYRYFQYRMCGANYAGSGWRIDGPQDPMDGFGLIWERDHFRLANDDYPAQSTQSSSNVDWDNGSSLGEGAGFRADGRQQCYDSGPTEPKPYDDFTCVDEDDLKMGWSDRLWGSARVRTGPDWEEGDEIQGVYTYQYNEQNDNFSIGVSYPWGLSIRWGSSTSVKQKSTQTEPDGRNMTVALSDSI